MTGGGLLRIVSLDSLGQKLNSHPFSPTSVFYLPPKVNLFFFFFFFAHLSIYTVHTRGRQGLLTSEPKDTHTDTHIAGPTPGSTGLGPSARGVVR